MTIRINLLDWRAANRERRRKRFLSILGFTVAGSLLIVLVGYLGMGAAVDHQKERNEYLRQQIAELDKQIKEIQELEKVKANLIARMNVIEQLQQSRSATVHFFDEIVNTLPDGVYLTSIKQSGANVTIDGIAESNGRISSYMKNLDASPWFRDPKLVIIKTGTQSKLRTSEFELQVTNLTKAADAGAAKAGGP